jgi:dTDP-4-amino-4,6-dideoxygalactose transaminase
MIPFNKPHLTGKEAHYIYQAVYQEGKISGNGKYTKLSQDYFQVRYNFKKCLLTTSCTDALEMAALLLDIKPGDEVIVPSYTFVSSALAFARQGARIVFCDSRPDHPGIDEEKVEELITKKTKAIVPVHYAGVACDMDKIMDIANRYGLYVIEDAAQAINSFYKEKPLGGIGHFGCFSFHETKNINCGEGGMLVINDDNFTERSEIIWEKGTNRASFFRGEVDKYGWVDIGSSFLPSDINAAYLFAQLEELDTIQDRRCNIWKEYYHELRHLAEKGHLKLPIIPEYASNNGHMFYITLQSLRERSNFINILKKKGILSVFHYQSLSESKFIKHNSIRQKKLPFAKEYTEQLVRLPLFYDLNDVQINYIINEINQFFN